MREPAAGGTLSFAELREVLELSLQAGRILVENGANTYRVEETVERVGTALGAERVHVYVTPTGIIATHSSGVEHRTKVLRIHHAGIDLNRVAAVIELARRAAAGELDWEGVRKELALIGGHRRLYGIAATVGSVACACACFAVQIGAGPKETVATAAAAGAAQWLRMILGKASVGRITLTVLVAFFASTLGLWAARAMSAPAPELALFSPVLLLVPGVLMVSSVADLFRGDVISGMARGMNAFLIIVTIGAGLWASTLLSGLQVPPARAAEVPLVAAAPLAFVAAMGFGVLFNVPYRALFPSSFVGMLAFSGQVVAHQLHTPLEVAWFFGGLVSALTASAASRWLRLPTSIFIIPGFIPLIPGVAAFRTVLALANGDYAAGTASLARTVILVGALAAGVGSMSALQPARRNW